MGLQLASNQSALAAGYVDLLFWRKTILLKDTSSRSAGIELKVLTNL